MNREPGHAPAPSRVVFVGNIPYDLSEEQIKEILGRVGPVIGFRLMFDRETGKPRGYGFCEYPDVDTAQSAIRNLNGFDIGGRTLRVDRADQESIGTRPAAAAAPAAASGEAALAGNPLLAPTGAPGTDAVHATLASMTNTQLLEVLTQLKNMAAQSPAQTRRLLTDNPALAYAVFQALAAMRLVDPQTVQAAIGAAAMAPAAPAAAPVAVAPAAQPPYGAAPQYAHPGPYGHAMPPPYAPPGPYNPPQAGVNEQQRALVSRILAMTPDEIAALPPQQRDQVMQIRAQFANQPR